MRRYQEHSPARSSPHEPRRFTTSDLLHKSHRQGSQDGYQHTQPDPRHLSEADINRLALQHRDTGALPLKAENLERLSREHHALEQASKHGGSAALLHASRSQPERRETLSYSGHDERGISTTRAFRPGRVESDLYLVEVEEEVDEDERRLSRERYVERDVGRRGSGRGRREGEKEGREREAVEIAHKGDRRVYKIM